MHEHSDCEHEIKYCKVCDVAYCKKCKREWGKTIYVSPNPYGSTWTWTYPYVITYTSGTTNAVVTHIHS